MKPLRQLKNIPVGEVITATVELCEKLNVAGSAPGYNLYAAIQKEQEKAKKYKNPKYNE